MNFENAWFGDFHRVLKYHILDPNIDKNALFYHQMVHYVDFCGIANVESGNEKRTKYCAVIIVQTYKS